MTYRIDLSPERQQLIEAAAQAQGVAVEVFIADAAELAAQEAREDAEDTEEARRILATSDPSQRRSLKDLRQAVRG
jgi:uncharacterized protein (DUF1778 family)